MEVPVIINIEDFNHSGHPDVNTIPVLWFTDLLSLVYHCSPSSSLSNTCILKLPYMKTFEKLVLSLTELRQHE